MSNSIPVGAVLNEAFQFGLQRWGTVIRLAWAPVLISLLLMAGFFGLAFNVETFAQAGEAETYAGFKEYLRLPGPAIISLGLLLYVLVALLYAGFMASIFRLVALGEQQPGFFTVRLDGPALRVFWALIITGLISTAIWCAAFAVALPLTGNSVGAFFGEMGAFFSAVLAAAETGSDDAAAQAAGMFNYWKTFLYTFAIAFIPLLYISVRLAPFIPGSAAENRLLLMGSFSLTKGQFWPILAAMFLMGVVVIVISIVFDLVSSLLEILMRLGEAGGAFALIAGIIGILYFGLMVFYYAVVYGAQLAFSAIIYRRLKTGE